jgi:transposase-like protein
MANNKKTRKILDTNWKDIETAYNNGMSIKDLSAAYGVSRQVLSARVSKIKNHMKANTSPALKILTLDIENAPMKAYVWGLWQQDIQQSMRLPDNRSYMMSVAAKWLHEDRVHYFETRTEDDSNITAAILKLVDEADIVVGHNVKNFDMKKINAYAVLNGLKPPAPYRVVDTMLIAKKHFAFERNTLEYLSKALCNIHKFEHKKFNGFELWSECIAGNEEAWAEMKHYNVQDVLATEELYIKLRSWDKGHPNVAITMNAIEHKCTSCGSSNVTKYGFSLTNVSKFQRYKCTDCGGFSRGRSNLLDKPVRDKLLTTVSNG